MWSSPARPALAINAWRPFEYVMNCRTWQFALFPLLCMLCFPPPISAQLRDASDESCPAATGNAEQSKPPHRKVIIEDVRFDAPIHLSYAALKPAVDEANRIEMDAEGNGWLDEFAEIGLRGTWQNQGYFNATVTAKAESLGSDSESKRFLVTAHVEEGLQYRVREVRFAGGTVFPTEQLRNAVPMHDGDLFDVSMVRQAIENLTKLYGSFGYIDFTAVPRTELADRPQLVTLVMELDEQKQYRIGQVSVVGRSSEMEALARSKFTPGDLFRPAVLDQFIAENKSALPAGASPEDVQITRNVREGIVDVTFYFLPGGAVEGTVVDQSGHPVQIAQVYFVPLSGLTQSGGPTKETNCNGHFVIEHLLPGTVEIRASKESDFYSDGLNGQLSRAGEQVFPQVKVGEGESVSGVVVRLGKQGGLLRVLVLDSDSKAPLSHVRYQLCFKENTDGQPYCGSIGGPGEYHTVVPSVPLALKITADNYEDWDYRDAKTGSPSLRLEPGEIKSFTVNLKPKNPKN